MKFHCTIKKSVAYLLAAVIFFVSSNYFIVTAASIRDVSTSKPAGGIVDTISGSLNVRKEANTTSDIVATLPQYSYVMEVGQSGDLYRV